MTNSDILRRLRFVFNFNDDMMMKLFQLGGKEVSREEVSNWLKKDDDENFVGIYDKDLAIFLNGLIIDRRGKREGPPPKPEKTLTNNIILRKLKIALAFRDEHIVDTLAKANIRASKHEINAFFRKETQSQYRKCKDQFLRNFIYGLQIKFRPEMKLFQDEEE
jgi:uncharacterized protein YehS (DUF1456 family)